MPLASTILAGIGLAVSATSIGVGIDRANKAKDAQKKAITTEKNRQKKAADELKKQKADTATFESAQKGQTAARKRQKQFRAEALDQPGQAGTAATSGSLGLSGTGGKTLLGA